MSKVININGKYELGDIKNNELKKIVKIFNDNIDEVKEELANDMSQSNFKFLLSNYIDTINNLSNFDDKCEELNEVLIILNTFTMNITNNTTIIDCILVFFNLFRVCKFDISKLTNDEIGSIINIYYTYEKELDFSIADSFSKFLVDNNFFEEVRRYKYDKHDISAFFIDAAACCMDDNIINIHQMKKYVREMLENYSYVDEKKSYDNLNDLYNYISEQVHTYIDLFLSEQNNDHRNIINRWLWHVDILKTKINNSNDEEKEIYFNEISNILFGDKSDNLSLEKKLNKVFAFIYPTEKIIQFESIKSK